MTQFIVLAFYTKEMIVHNVDAAQVDLIFTINDTINLSFDVEKYNDTTGLWEAYDMTGMQLDMHVRKCDGTLVRALTSAGVGAEITVLVDKMTLYGTGFLKRDKLKYDVQVTDTDVMTIMKGNLFIRNEQTI